MNIDELKETHSDYKKNVDEWKMYKAAYEGTKELLDWGAIKQNSRESADAYSARLEKSYGFNYTSRIMSIINSYLFQKPSSSDYSVLKDDQLFQLFMNDADLSGTEYNTVIVELQKWAGVYGHMGLLIDKPRIEGVRTISDDVSGKIYPFITAYSPLNILDWRIEKVNGQKVLTYIKLLEDDGKYRIFTRDSWELWDVNDKDTVLVNMGENPLGVIPFVIMLNEKSSTEFIGKSDIKEIARMDISILRLLSGAEEVFNLASFPMLMKPYLAPGLKDNDTVGAANVVEFDPKNPGSKPEWLKTAIAEPIESVMSWINNTIEEMYKSINANGLNSGSQAKSGEALKREFQALNSFLAKKSKFTIERSEKQIIYFWLLWQNKAEVFDQITISRPTDFDIKSLSEDLDNFTIAKNIVNSRTFSQNIEKVISRKVLTNTRADDQNIIDKEIEKGVTEFEFNTEDE